MQNKTETVNDGDEMKGSAYRTTKSYATAANSGSMKKVTFNASVVLQLPNDDDFL